MCYNLWFLTFRCTTSSEIKAKNETAKLQQTSAPEYCDINEDEMQVDSEVAETIVEMEVSTAESPDENEHNRIYPGASEEGRSSSEVDEVSEEAEYRNIPGEDGTPEYENEARIEDGEDDGLGSRTDVSTGSAAPINPLKNMNYTVLDTSTRDNPGPPSIYKRLKSKPFNPNSTNQPVTCVEADMSPFDSVDVECCNIESLKPKLPTPESSSLSGGSNWWCSVWIMKWIVKTICSVNTISWITICKSRGAFSIWTAVNIMNILHFIYSSFNCCQWRSEAKCRLGRK